MKGKTSIIAIGALALITFVLVAGVLSAAQKQVPVVVAARAPDLCQGGRFGLSQCEAANQQGGGEDQSEINRQGRSDRHG